MRCVPLALLSLLLALPAAAQQWVLSDLVNRPPPMPHGQDWPFVGGVVMASPVAQGFDAALVCRVGTLTLADTSDRSDPAGAAGEVAITVANLTLRLPWEVVVDSGPRRIALARTLAVQALRASLDEAHGVATLAYDDGRLLRVPLAGFASVAPTINSACPPYPEGGYPPYGAWVFSDLASEPDPEISPEDYPYLNGMLLASVFDLDGGMVLHCEGGTLAVVMHRAATSGEGTATLEIDGFTVQAPYVVYEISGDAVITLTRGQSLAMIQRLRAVSGSDSWMQVSYSGSEPQGPTWVPLKGNAPALGLALGACS